MKKNYFSKRSLIRPYIFLSVLGSISLLSGHAFSMELSTASEAERSRSPSPTFPSSLSKRIDTELDSKLRLIFKALPRDENTVPNKEQLAFFSTLMGSCSRVSTEGWVRAMLLLAKHGKKKEKERSGFALLKVLEEEKHPEFPKLNIATYWMESVPDFPIHHKQALEKILKADAMDLTRTPEERANGLSFLFLNGSEKIRLEMAAFLREILHRSDPSFLFSNRLRIMKSIMEEGKADEQREFGKTGLIQILGKTLEEGASFEECKNSLGGGYSKREKRDLSDVFLSIAEDRNLSLSSENRFNAALEVYEIGSRWGESLENGEREAYTNRVTTLLSPLFYDSSISLKSRIAAADRIKWVTTFKQDVRPFLLSCVANEDLLSPMERLEIGVNILGTGFHDKQEQESHFNLLVSLLDVSKEEQSLEQLTKTIGTISWHLGFWDSDQARQVSQRAQLYAMLSFKVEAFPDSIIGVVGALRAISSNGAEAQREKACSRLLSLSQKEGISPADRLSILNCVVENGTEIQKREASVGLLANVGSTSTEERIKHLKMIATKGQGEQKEEALRLILELVKDRQLSSEQYFDLLNILVFNGTTDQKEVVFKLFEERFRHPDEFSNIERYVNWIRHQLLNKRYPTERASNVFLSFLEILEEGLKKILPFTTLQDMLGIIRGSNGHDEVARADAILLFFMESAESFSDEYEKTLSRRIQGMNEQNKEHAVRILLSVLKRSTESFKVPEEIIDVITWHGSEEQQQAVKNILFALLQTPQNLSEDDLTRAARHVLHSELPAHKERAEQILISLSRRLKESPQLEDSFFKYLGIAEIFAHAGSPEQKEEMCEGLLTFLGEEDEESLNFTGWFPSKNAQICKYVLSNGTPPQKEGICRILVLRMADSEKPLSLEDLKEMSYRISWSGTIAQSVTNLTILLQHPEFSFADWESFFRYAYEGKEEDADAEKRRQEKIEQIASALLEAIESSESKISLERRVKVAHKFSWMQNLKARAHNFLGSILKESEKFPQEVVQQVAEQILWDRQSPEHHRALARTYLLSLMNDDSRSLEERFKIAKLLMSRLHSREEKREADTFLVNTLDNVGFSLAERKDLALSMVSDWGDERTEQTERVCAFLLSLLNSSELPLVQQDRVEIARRVVKNGTQEQKQRANHLLLTEGMQRSEFKTLYSYVSMLEDAIRHGTSDDEKETVGRALIEVYQDQAASQQSSDFWETRRALMIVLTHGTQKLKEDVVEILWRSFDNQDQALKDRVSYLYTLIVNCKDASLSDHRHRALSLLAGFAKDVGSGLNFGERLSAFDVLLEHGDAEQRNAAGTFLLSLVQEESHWFSLKTRLENIHKLTGRTGLHKEQACSLLLKLMRETREWSPQDRLKEIETFFYHGTPAQMGEAFSIVLSFAQDMDMKLSLKERFELIRKVFWHGTENQRTEAYKFLCCLELDPTLSEENRVAIATLLIGESYSYEAPKRTPEQIERVCAVLLSSLEKSDSTLLPEKHLQNALTVVSRGTPLQKEQGYALGLALIRLHASDLSQDRQSLFLVEAIQHGREEQSKEAEEFLFSIFENPGTDLETIKSVARSLRYFQREASFGHDTEELRDARHNFQLLRDKHHQRLVASLLNFENGLSLENRVAAAEQMTESYANYSPHTKAFDVLLTLMERQDAPLKKRLEISKTMLSYHGDVKEESQKARARDLLWSVLVDERTEEKDKRDAGVFLVRYAKSTSTPAGAGAILLSLMKDPNLLSDDRNYWPDHGEQRSKEVVMRERALIAQSDIAFFLIEYGQTEDEKNEARDFILTLIEDSDPSLSLEKRSELGGQFIEENISDDQKVRVGSFLLSLIEPLDTGLSPEKCRDSALSVVNHGTLEHRERTRPVLVRLLAEPSMFSYLHDYLQDRYRAHYVNRARTINELSPDRKDYVRSVFFSFARQNQASLSDSQKNVLREMSRHFSGIRPRMELSMILSGARIPEGRYGVLLNVLEIVGTELLNLVPIPQTEQMICRVALELNLQRWGDMIEETLVRYRPQAPRRGPAAMAPRAMTVSEEIERQRVIANEIHQFMHVSDREGSIHDQVLHRINCKLSSVTNGTQIVLKTYEQALAALKGWIKDNVPEGESSVALRVTLSGLSQPVAKTYLAKIYTYLVAFHNAESINAWMTGFIGEALRAYSDHASCPQGVEERMITGLRGINDHVLDAVFRKAEVVFSAKAFIRSCNFMEGGNKKWLVKKLQELGITQESSADDAARVFREFGESHIRNLDFRSLDLGHQERSYTDQVHTFAELLKDYYDAEFRPVMGSTLASQISSAIAAANPDV